MEKKGLKSLLSYFSKGEWLLWSVSMTVIAVSFFLFGGKNYLTLAASLLGATSLIFNAKGNPAGPLLIIFFSLLYGRISYTSAYYGEMITYLGMTMPMSVFALISWLKNPYQGSHAEVAVDSMGKKEAGFMAVLTAAVTVVFYFILKFFSTANLLPSTLSVTTSFLAVYLTFRRNPYYALAYAANDVILIILWLLAGNVPVIVCFLTFFVNDIYGFVNWSRMQKRQQAAGCLSESLPQ